MNYSSADTNDKSKDFLGYVASIPYEGSKPAEAREWLKNNIHHNASITIGNVRFEIVANAPRARILNVLPVRQ